MMSENQSTAPKCQRCGAPVGPDAPEGLCPRCLMALNLAAPTEMPGETGPHGTKVVKPPLPPADLAKHFPQLEILECLGRGGMGVVYKARQPKLNRFVALKLLAPEKGADPKFSERFLREAQALARLSHQNIVTVYDFGETDGLYFLLMEFVDGLSLRQLLQQKKIAPEQALAIVPKICEALQFAHEQGVVHRDIKPENVLLDKQGRVKIADFGIAKIVGGDGGRTNLTGEEQVIGTPHYMAPEQVEKPQTVDHRADIYSLGVVFYEMLTGELPLGKFAAPSKIVQVDVRLDEVVLHALEKEPGRRYQHASVLKTDVETIASSASAAAPVAPLGAASTGTAGKAFSGAPNAAREARALPETPPRFSRTAIVGACWAPLLFITALLMFSTSVPIAVPAGHAPPGPVWWQILLMVTLLPLGLTAPFGTTILGWIAVSQIRRSAGRLYGLGLAVFDGLVFPLLAADALVVGFFWLLSTNFVPNSAEANPRLAGAICFALLIGLALLVAVLIDYLLIRLVWRAVTINKTSPATPIPSSAPNTPLAWFAVGFASLSGVLGGLTFFTMPQPPALLVWSILAAALLGIALGITTRKTARGKQAIAIGCVNTAIWLIVAAFTFRSSVSPSTSPESAEVRYGVFEADAALVDKLVPPETRVRGDLPDSDEFNRRTVRGGSPPNATAQMAQINATTVKALASGISEEKDLLMEHSRDVPFSIWPRLADGESYSRTNGVGGMNGFVGVRRANGRLQLRVQYHVSHLVNVREAVSAEIFCEDNAPPHGDALAFFIPFSHEDGAAKYLIIAFVVESEQTNAAPTENQPAEESSKPVVSPTMRKVYELMMAGKADLAIAELQKAGTNSDPDIPDMIRDLKEMQRLAAAEPWTFGPVIERVLAKQGSDRRALNLATGNYVTPAPGRELDFGPNGTNTLRAAGVDLFISDEDADRESVTSLDLRESSQFFPQGGDDHNPAMDDHNLGIDSISAEVFHLMQDKIYHHPFKDDPDSADFFDFVRKRNLRPHEEVMRGTNVFTFITRDGAEGLLQIAGVTDNPRTVILRYKLAQKPAATSPMPATAAQNLSFGPVIEQVLRQNDPSGGDVCLIDLDKNRTFAKPPRLDPSSEAFGRWITNKGIDALAVTLRGDFQGLVGWDMRLLQVGPDIWENRTPAAALTILKQLESVQQLPETIMRAENTLPTTFLFKTREGGVGVLQITGFPDNPRRVEFRYKLAQKSKPTQKTGANENAPLVVNIDAEGNLRLGADASPITVDQLASDLAARADRNPGLKLEIRADKNAPMAQLVKVTDAARAAKISVVSAVTAPAVSKRQRFVPEAGKEKETSWAVLPKPSDFNPNGWVLMANMTLGGVAPVRLLGEKADLCRMKMTKGSDDQITLQIEDLREKHTLTITLGRDQPAEILVNGKGHRVLYPSIYVATNEPDTSHITLVTLTEVPPSAGARSSRSFILRHKPASQVKENLRWVLHERADITVVASTNNGTLTVTAPPDVLNRVATFIVVEDWPDYVKETPQVEAAKKFFRLCAEEDVERVGKMLSIYVLLELMGKSIERYPPVSAADVEAVRQATGDWPGKEAAIRAVIAAYTKYPLKSIRQDDGGRDASIVFSYMPVVEFEGAPKEFGRINFFSGVEQMAVNCLPPWFSIAEARAAAKAQTAELEFRLVAAEGDRSTPADELADPGDRTGQRKLPVSKEVLLDSSAVESAKLENSKGEADVPPGAQTLSIVLKPDAVEKLAKLTAANTGRRLAIVWRGRVLSAPLIRDPINGPAVMVTGNLSEAEWRVLVDLLNFKPGNR